MMNAHSVLRNATENLNPWAVLLLAVSSLVFSSGDALARQSAAPVAEKPVQEKRKQAKQPAVKEEGDKSAVKEWVRVVRDDKEKPLSLDTAIVRYRGAGASKGLAVDLIGAIHVGDKSYYEKLNKEFEQYDALLYELVAPEGTVIPRGGRKGGSGHPIGALQDGMKKWLDLEHQLTLIDYTKQNFVHADMSPDQFAQAMKDRDESFTKLFFRLMGRSMAMQSRMQAEGKSSPDAEIFSALFAKDRARKLKIALAGQFGEMESMLTGFGGPKGTTIITGRNEVALKVLKERIEKGEKKIGIFYGAGHMVDMDKRLRKEFQLEPVEVVWVTAWDLTRE